MTPKATVSASVQEGNPSIEFVLTRVHYDDETSHEKDAEKGFKIRGPGIVDGRIRFEKWSHGDAEADTPWGKVFVSAEPFKKTKRTWCRRIEWTPPSGIKTYAEIELSYKSFLDLVVSNGSSSPTHLRLKNRSLPWNSVYRHIGSGGKVEIVTEIVRFSFEWRNTTWRIRLSGNMVAIADGVVLPLAVLLCYYKVFNAFVTERGWWQHIWLQDSMF